MNNTESPKPQYEKRREEDDDFEEASQSMADYARSIVPPKPQRRYKRLVLSVVLVVVLVGAGAAYFFMKKPAPAAKPAQKSSAAHTTPTPKKVATKEYSSTNFNLNFNYPATWTVTEAEDGSQIAVRSPAQQLKSAAGKVADGQIVVTINRFGQSLPMFDAGNAVAVRESEKIAYSRPAQTQRASTYLSFLQYASTTTPGALDGIYITGDFGYQTGQAIPKGDIAKPDPLISVIFVSCAVTDCTKTAPLSVPVSLWSDDSFVQPIKITLQSLTIN